MTCLLYTHDSFAQHITPPGNPEHTARITAVETALQDAKFNNLIRKIAPAAAIEDIALAHSKAHIDKILAPVAKGTTRSYDSDTHASPQSPRAARHGVGAVVNAVDDVMAGLAPHAFCALRPPGHHAEYDRAMGFCMFANLAIGAFYARKKYGLERLAVLDWDVHHGNGTQSLFEKDKNLFFGSTHQMPLFPGTGYANETGIDNNVMNRPMKAGDGQDEFAPAFEEILAATEKFRPDMIFISAGFDSHKDDPVGSMRLVEQDFVWATNRVLEVADKLCKGRVISALEGGYNVKALANCVCDHVEALM